MAVELVQELLLSAGASGNTLPSSEVPVLAGGDPIGSAAELDKAKARIAELKSVEAITVRRHEGLLDEVKHRHAEDISV